MFLRSFSEQRCLLNDCQGVVIVCYECYVSVSVVYHTQFIVVTLFFARRASLDLTGLSVEQQEERFFMH